MKTRNAPFIVFSDLDGTLLDHETYSWEPARPALDTLRMTAVPLILASSKTAAEITGLRAAMGFADCPAIVENGAGLLEPAECGAHVDDDSVHRRLVAILDSLPLRLRENFSGFSDWDIDEVAERTGLPREEAANAARRCFSEPGLWCGNDEDRGEFLAILAAKGVRAKQGGRYLTLSFGATKADRMRELASRYSDDGRRPLTVALGDAPNDIEMLETADIGVVVANPHTAPLPELDGERVGRILRTESPGPEGWSRTMLRIIDELANGKSKE